MAAPLLRRVRDAAIAGDFGAFRALLLGATDHFDVNAPEGGRNGRTLVHLLVVDVDDARDHAWRILEDTIRSGEEAPWHSFFVLLRSLGADANRPDASGDVPLCHMAYEFQNACSYMLGPDLVRVLGADPNLPVVRDRCIENALQGGHWDLSALDFLVELGCELPRDGRYTDLLFFGGPERHAYCYVDMLKGLLERGLIAVDERGQWLHTPLHCAVMHLDLYDMEYYTNTDQNADEIEMSLALELVKVLLGAGANPCLVNEDGENPLEMWNRLHPCRGIPGDTNDVKELLANAIADRSDALRLELFDAFARSSAGKFLGEHVCTTLIRPLVLYPPHPRGPMSQRRERLTLMLRAEGIAPDGHYYDDCLRGVKPIDMREFRLRHHIATAGAPEYMRIVRRLRMENVGYYSGIHADARAEFKATLAQRGFTFETPGAVPAAVIGTEESSSSDDDDLSSSPDEDDDDDRLF